MPDIRISYRAGNIRPNELLALREFIQEQCAASFSNKERPLEPSSFDVYYVPLAEGSYQVRTVAIRVTLPYSPAAMPLDRGVARWFQISERGRLRQRSAEVLVGLVWGWLNTETEITNQGIRTVSVSLVFAEIAEASA